MTGAERLDGEIVDPHLVAVVHEIETHAAASGWDRPATLFALVETADFIAREPILADLLDLEAGEPGSLTPIEQDQFDRPLEEVLPEIGFGDTVAGIAVVVERPEGEAEQARVVVGVTRAGRVWCAMRSRTHDSAEAVVGGIDVAPELIDLMRAVMEDEPMENEPRENKQ